MAARSAGAATLPQSVTLIAVSGNGGGPFRFDELKARLEGVHRDAAIEVRLVTPALTGFDGEGRERRSVAGLGMADWAAELEDALARIAGPKVLFGHGVGGCFVLELLRRARVEVEGVILHAPVGARLRARRFPKLMRLPLVRQSARAMIASPLLRPLWRRRFFSTPLPDAVVDRFFAGYRRCRAFGRMFEVIDADWFESLPARRVPARLLWGGRERLLDPSQARAFLRVLPRAGLEVVADWTHFPMFDDPAGMARRLRATVTSLLEESGVLAPSRTLPPFDLPRLGEEAVPPETGSKALQLEVAARAGLPVPPAVLVPDELHDDSIERGDAAGGAADVDPRLAAAIDAAFGADRSATFAVRSAFDTEDGAGRSGAGAFRTELRVAPAGLIDALVRVRASGRGGARRRDVVIQHMVAAERAGVAFTEAEFEDDLVDWAAGLGDRVVRDGGTALQLPKLERFEQRRGPRSEVAWQERLQELLRRVRELFGATLGADLDVEWADDGRVCWLLQVRPITAKPRRGSLFTVANHKEILPELPSVLMASVLDANAGALYEHYRRYDPTLPSTRPFLRSFHGRPRIDLSLLTDTVRRWGLPTRLVTDSIGGGTEVDRGFQVRRLLRNWRVLVRMGIAQVRSASRARTLSRELRSPAKIDNFADFVSVFGRTYVALVHGMMDLTAAMAPPLATLRKFGWLELLASRHRTVTSELFLELESLRRELPDDPVLRETLGRGEWPSGHAFGARLDAAMQRFGHRGVFESDIGRPRTREEPAAFLRSLVEGSPHRGTTADLGVRRSGPRGAWLRRLSATVFGTPVWWLARRPLAARERLRDEAMHGFERLRTDLLVLARRASEQGLLPAPEAVFDMEVDELRALDQGRAFSEEHWSRRRERIEARRQIDLPDLFSSADPLANREGPIAEGALRGLGLVEGRVDGPAFVARSPDARPPAELGEGFVLVAPAVDAGWIPLLTRAAAVVVETGGDLSHGSIVLREVGVVSVTNARGAMRLESGVRLRVDGAAGIVEQLGGPPPRAPAARTDS